MKGSILNGKMVLRGRLGFLISGWKRIFEPVKAVLKYHHERENQMSLNFEWFSKIRHIITKIVSRIFLMISDYRISSF